MLRKILIATCAAALTTSPAWAHGRADHDATSHGRSHKCAPHKVGYVASGTLDGHTLVLDAAAAADGANKPTYSGDVTIDVKRGNKAARGDKGTTKTYALDHARVVLGLGDQNADGRVDLADVATDSRVKAIGKVTKLAKTCDQTGFTPTLTIKKVIVHEPKPATS